MPYTVRFDPAVNSQQAQVIPDATPSNDGVMTKQQAALLAAGGTPGPPGPPGPIGPAGSSALLFWGGGNVSPTTTTRYLVPGFGDISPTGIVEISVARAGTLRNLFVRHNTASGNGNSVVYTVIVNGVATALTVALATGAIGTASNLVNTVAVVQGDRVALRVTKAVAIGSGMLDATADIEVA